MALTICNPSNKRTFKPKSQILYLSINIEELIGSPIAFPTGSLVIFPTRFRARSCTSNHSFSQKRLIFFTIDYCNNKIHPNFISLRKLPCVDY
jgi:hypothetical protein